MMTDLTIDAYKRAFRRYEHPFESVLETVKAIRRLKSDLDLGDKRIDVASITIKNCRFKFVLTLRNLDDIARLCKVDNLYLFFVDEEDETNNLAFKYSE